MSCLPGVYIHDILQRWVIRRGNWLVNKDKKKVILLEVKFESTINGGIKEAAHGGNDDPAVVRNS